VCRKNTEDMINVMQAYVNGEQIQANDGGGTDWYDDTSPEWNWAFANYRIKPEDGG
jgi:hypothetical protein